jgi:hypothetical protein
VQRGLHAAAIQRRLGGCGSFQPAVTVRKQQRRVAMRLPEPAQQLQRYIWQRDKTIFVPLGVADVDALMRRIDVADLKAQSFSQA